MFHPLVDWMLALHQEYSSAYVDNIVIYAISWDQHMSTLRAVLQELRQTGLTANP